MNIADFVDTATRKLTERQRRDRLILTLTELRQDWDWDDIIDAVREARYIAECTDETDDSDYARPR